MPPLTCELRSGSIQTHLQQIYAGFLLLHRAGRIRVRQRIERTAASAEGPQHLRDSSTYGLRVLVDGRVRAYYDAHDSWEVDERVLAGVDCYFKRSYAPHRLEHLGRAGAKVRPLGLNYALYPDGFDRFGLERSLRLATGARRIYEAARAIGVSDWVAFSPRLGAMSAPPDSGAPARVLFLVRAFDPHDDPGRPREKVEERIGINDARARSIQALRREFGDRFYGGFVHTPHARARYPEWLAPDARRCAKARYIALLRSFPICVATTGIHGSIGWKFAEYVAFSRAIVSERLNYEVVGDLRRGDNYLEFSTTDECLAQTRRLLDDADLRRALMVNNANYYERYLRPDAMILNTIEIAAAESSRAA